MLTHVQKEEERPQVNVGFTAGEHDVLLQSCSSLNMYQRCRTDMRISNNSGWFSSSTPRGQTESGRPQTLFFSASRRSAFTWSWCIWSQPSCPRTQRVWPARPAAANARLSVSRGMWSWSVCCSARGATLPRRCARRCRLQMSSWCPSPWMRCQCPGGPVSALCTRKWRNSLSWSYAFSYHLSSVSWWQPFWIPFWELGLISQAQALFWFSGTTVTRSTWNAMRTRCAVFCPLFIESACKFD